MHTHFIIPAYKESERLPTFLKELLAAIDDCDLMITVQVVDDGSGTAEAENLKLILAPLLQKYSFFRTTLFLKSNLGKGGAVYSGWRQAPECDTLAFVDADGSIPARELIRLTKLACQTPDTAIFGSRILMLGRHVERSSFRHYVGRVFATLAGTLLEMPVYDSQCGIKLIPASVFQVFNKDCEEYGFAFDMELLMFLYQHQCPTAEEPIDWHDTPGSKVNVLSDGIRMIFTLMRLRQRFLPTR